MWNCLFYYRRKAEWVGIRHWMKPNSTSCSPCCTSKRRNRRIWTTLSTSALEWHQFCPSSDRVQAGGNTIDLKFNRAVKFLPPTISWIDEERNALGYAARMGLGGLSALGLQNLGARLCVLAAGNLSSWLKPWRDIRRASVGPGLPCFGLVQDNNG